MTAPVAWISRSPESAWHRIVELVDRCREEPSKGREVRARSVGAVHGPCQKVILTAAPQHEVDPPCIVPISFENIMS